MASLARARSSCPRSFSEGGGVWLSANSANADVEFVNQAGNEVVGVGEGDADGFDEVLFADLAVLGVGEELRGDVE